MTRDHYDMRIIVWAVLIAVVLGAIACTGSVKLARDNFAAVMARTFVSAK